MWTPITQGSPLFLLLPLLMIDDHSTCDAAIYGDGDEDADDDHGGNAGKETNHMSRDSEVQCIVRWAAKPIPRT